MLSFPSFYLGGRNGIPGSEDSFARSPSFPGLFPLFSQTLLQERVVYPRRSLFFFFNSEYARMVPDESF